MKKVFLVFTFALLALVLILLIRTLSFTPAVEPQQENRSLPLDEAKIAQHLSEAIRFRTVSSELKRQAEHREFPAFISWLHEAYPLVHDRLPLERLGKYSLLFKWQGSQADLPPILLSAHYDVVPVIPGSEDLWQHPPYLGHVDKTHIWGRGALDDKSAVVALMEAVTYLLTQDYVPERSIYLSFTHDEEIGGPDGTAAVVEALKAQAPELEFSLDEGSFILDGFFPGMEQSIASINVAEKGSMVLNLVANAEGGHSSMPPQETAVGILAEAILKLQSSPVPGGLSGLSESLLDAIARHFPFEQRLLFANRWLFGSMIEREMSKQAPSNAMLRTTTAPTMLSASVKVNVLPIEAVASVNFRLHPRDTVESIKHYVESLIDDERIEVQLEAGGRGASRVSDANSRAFHKIADAAKQTYGNLVVAPGLTIAGTDSRRYEAVAKNAYRFNPMLVTSEDTAGFHGTNERISIDNMLKATNFYALLIESASSE